ncbi:16S rRNA (cytidine(1402)-2'-O)-methyltransferase [Candidatus Pelagibacter sp.]|nr:16S rRNA (cytidine(1402)-2'-O)-methyltransferase [Candidatus Pelagibacter sp.]
MILNNKSDNIKIKKGLYVVSTPIGNLADISERSIKTLIQSDYILCEDTRVSKKLLKKFNINSQLISYHKFNEKKNLSKIINLLKSGQIISIISDAGTPAISDPGGILINECIKNDINISLIPGPSAVISAVSISGFSDKFYFYGFFPEKNKILNDDFKVLSQLDCSIVFFVSAKKLNKTIPIFKKYFSGRKILICKEMTKLYEEFFREDIDNLEIFEKNFKGELTVVISEIKTVKITSQKLSESDKDIIKKINNKLTVKEIVDLISRSNDIPRKEIYNYCIKLKNEN